MTIYPKTAREIAREELASFCGLMLRRVQEKMDAPDRHDGLSAWSTVTLEDLAQMFGEALRDFSATEAEPGA
jgi:hypothetical protein